MGQETTGDLLQPWCLLVRVRCIQHNMRSHHYHHADACNLEAATQVDAKVVSGCRVFIGMVRGLYEHNENSLTPFLRKIKGTNLYAVLPLSSSDLA